MLILGPQAVAKRTPAASTPLGTTSCTGSLTRTTTGDITVPNGGVCRISSSTVNGSVTVLRDAYFEAGDTKINGSIRAADSLTVFLHDATTVRGSVVVDSAAQLFLYKSRVGGTVTVNSALAPGFGHVQVCDTAAGGIDVRGSGPDVLLGDPEAGCVGNSVGNDVWVVGNSATSELEVSGNTIGGSLVVTDNTGQAPKNVTANIVQGRIDLSNNSAPFASANNGPAQD
jgi:hypothetical protein